MRGFSLIEVLVAVFVGVLGAGATQLAALRTRHESHLMSAAVQLAASLAERMQANAGVMHLPDGDNPYLTLHYDAAEGAPSPPASLCLAGAACNGAQLAALDLFEFKQALHRHFPGGRVRVCRDAQPWNGASHALGWSCAPGAAPVVIKLGWRGKNPDGSAAQDGAQQFAPSVALTLAEVK